VLRPVQRAGRDVTLLTQMPIRATRARSSLPGPSVFMEEISPRPRSLARRRHLHDDVAHLRMRRRNRRCSGRAPLEHVEVGSRPLRSPSESSRRAAAERATCLRPGRDPTNTPTRTHQHSKHSNVPIHHVLTTTLPHPHTNTHHPTHRHDLRRQDLTCKWSTGT